MQRVQRPNDVNSFWARAFSGPGVLLLLGLLTIAPSCPAGEAVPPETVRIGVLSFRSQEQTLERWQPTADYLGSRIPRYAFRIVPLFYKGLDQAVAERSLDFVFTNTGHYVELEAAHGISRLATLVKTIAGKPVESFGGVIFTRADRHDINAIADLRGRRLMAVDDSSLGGFLVAWFELHKRGIDPRSDLKELIFNGMPHDRVVQRVLAGEADAGTVRTSVLESMAAEGTLRLEDIKVLDPVQHSELPFLHSTPLYPEWPFARLPGTDEELARQVAIALLDIPKDHPAALAGGYQGWTVPLNYQPVHALMRELRTGPYANLGRFTFADVLDRYRVSVFLVLLTALTMAALVAVKMGRMNLALRREVSERMSVEMSLRESEARLYHLAHHDSLTHLPNRLLFHDRLQHALDRATREDTAVAVLFLDLDRFKNINDTLGHALGDRLLREAARRLTTGLRRTDTLARLGGDEFVVILEDVPDAGAVIHVAGNLVEQMSAPFSLDRYQLASTVSIGISLFPEDGQDVVSLMRCADVAMYRAKALGRNQLVCYSRDLDRTGMKRLQMEQALARAISGHELRLYYQPQFDMQSGRLIGMEALVRWQHPELGLQGPDEFIPLAEETGQILALGEWTLTEACRQLDQWRRQGREPVPVAVNLSARQLRQEGLGDKVRELIRRWGLRPELLELEVTESAAMEDMASAVSLMGELRDLGVRWTLDDFGTGYSSLSHLHHLPVSRLKIDRSFIQSITADDDPAAIPLSILALGASLGLEVLAEGVETDVQRRFLLRHGCALAQGFLFGHPRPAEEIEHHLDFADARVVTLGRP